MIYDFIVVGAGQAGLAIAYYLKREGFNFLVIDGDDSIGGSWLRRWDSLKLFTPSEFNHLPGLAFPQAKGLYPDKHGVAKYLIDYVEKFDLPVRLKSMARNVRKVDGVFEILTNEDTLQAQYVIVATGPFHTPAVPEFAKHLNDDIVQLHSSDYKNPKQLKPGKTLVVGGGDSGVQILEELAQSLPHVYFSGQVSSWVLPQELLGKTLWWWLQKLGILGANKYSWLGKMLSNRPQPIIGTDVKKLLARDNVHVVGRAISAQENMVRCEKDLVAGIRNVIWATGFRPDFSWIENIPLDESGYPDNYRGISKLQGMYFIGLPWMFTRGSATLGGVKEDAEFLTSQFTNKAAAKAPIQTGLRG